MRALFSILASLLLAACQQQPEPLPPVSQSHELVVVTHNGPVTYYVNGQNRFAGPEYDMAKMFSEYLGKQLGEPVRLKILGVGNITQVIPTLLKDQAHLAAANLSITPLRKHLVRFGPAYQDVQQQVVYNQEAGRAPKSTQDMVGKTIVIPAGTSYAERLKTIAETEPNLQWQESRQSNSDELLEQIADGVLDYTIADSHLIAMQKNYHPNLGTAFNFGPAEKLAWAFPKNGDDWLYRQAEQFFELIKKDGRLRALHDRYYGASDRLKPLDTRTFLIKSETLLPKYLPLFKQAQTLTGLDWRLLAALSYQESHWDTYATSPTNVRGLMMLTEDTADRLGVTDRLDPNQSIPAGARYVVTLKEMLPERIAEPDRTWLALAAYNIGFAHLEDARILAQRMKLNPDSWADVKKTLPLLSKEEYYTTLRYGFARGGAPVVYVERIRAYYGMLQKHEPQHFTPIMPSFSLAWIRQQVDKIY